MNTGRTCDVTAWMTTVETVARDLRKQWGGGRGRGTDNRQLHRGAQNFQGQEDGVGVGGDCLISGN
jgi:hypothetical protein